MGHGSVSCHSWVECLVCTNSVDQSARASEVEGVAVWAMKNRLTCPEQLIRTSCTRHKNDPWPVFTGENESDQRMIVFWANGVPVGFEVMLRSQLFGYALKWRVIAQQGEEPLDSSFFAYSMGETEMGDSFSNVSALFLLTFGCDSIWPGKLGALKPNFAEVEVPHLGLADRTASHHNTAHLL